MYHAEQEFPVYTAAILDDFMYSFGKGHNGKFVDPGIQRLTIVLRWKFEVGDQVSEPIDSDIENEMVDQIFLVTRMLCILQYYEICATLTFPGTSTCLAAAFMRLYSLRKSTAPAFDYGKPWRWWRWANVSRSGGDRTFGEICGDSKAKSLYIEGKSILSTGSRYSNPLRFAEGASAQTGHLQVLGGEVRTLRRRRGAMGANRESAIQSRLQRLITQSGIMCRLRTFSTPSHK